MNLYLISRKGRGGYDTFSDAVVVAKNMSDASMIHPNGRYHWGDGKWVGADDQDHESDDTWVHPGSVNVVLIGVAIEDAEESLVICSSFHAG